MATSVPFTPFHPGTLAATLNSTAVVGSGTAFSQYSLYDVLLMDDGLFHAIAAIADDTHLTLHAETPYKGTTGSGKAYDWIPTPDQTRVLALLTTLNAMVSNGTLAALASAGSSANTVPAFTGAGAAELLPFGASGIAILAAASAIVAQDAASHHGTSILSAATLNLDAVDGTFITVTGNVGCSAITLTDGRMRRLLFTGTPVLTPGANLKLNNGGVAYQVAAGDAAFVWGDASGLVRVLLQPADGDSPIPGLPLAGGTLTGNLTIAPASGDADFFLNKAASGGTTQIIGRTGGLNRWLNALGDSTVEAGSNAGSNYYLIAYNDAGTTQIGVALSIVRSTLAATFGGTLTVAGVIVAPAETLSGAGSTNTDYINGQARGGSLELNDTGGSLNNGGHLLFSAATAGIFAGIKGALQNGTGPDGDLIFQARSTTGNALERMRIVGLTGAVAMKGLLDISASGAGQIAFPATQNPSSGANVQDDYEEGMWTSGFTFGGAAVGMTFSTQVASYDKIGREVLVDFTNAMSAKGSSTGIALITGLPFTVASTFNSVMSICPPNGTFVSLVAGLSAYIDAGATTANIMTPGTSGSANAADTNFTSSSFLIGGGRYHTT